MEIYNRDLERYRYRARSRARDILWDSKIYHLVSDTESDMYEDILFTLAYLGVI